MPFSSEATFGILVSLGYVVYKTLEYILGDDTDHRVQSHSLQYSAIQSPQYGRPATSYESSDLYNFQRSYVPCDVCFVEERVVTLPCSHKLCVTCANSRSTILHNDCPACERSERHRRTTRISSDQERNMRRGDQVSGRVFLGVCLFCDERISSTEVKRFHCEHRFHRECIAPWIELQNDCPVCSSRIRIEMVQTIGAAVSSNRHFDLTSNRQSTSIELPICSMCNERLHRRVRPTFHCNHIFHNDCISPWLRLQKNCPVCESLSTPIFSEDVPSSVKYCSFCNNRIRNSQDGTQFKCEHIFHNGCINNWLTQKSVCPVCKKRSLLGFKYLKTEHLHLEEGQRCCICHERFNNPQGKLLRCQHKVHLPCLLSWMRENARCPHCKSAIAEGKKTRPVTKKEPEVCSICLERITYVRKTVLPCLHKFHKDCIETWTDFQNTCPLCRQRVS